MVDQITNSCGEAHEYEVLEDDVVEKGEIVPCKQSLPSDPSLPCFDEDAKSVNQMFLLTKLARKKSGSLMVHDGVTGHCVGFTRLYREGRSYRIVYRDPIGPGAPSFLSGGRNCAGVRARAEDIHKGLWSVSHEELFRVLRTVLMPKE